MKDKAKQIGDIEKVIRYVFKRLEYDWESWRLYSCQIQDESRKTSGLEIPEVNVKRLSQFLPHRSCNDLPYSDWWRGNEELYYGMHAT